MNQQQWREFLNKSSITTDQWSDANEHSNWWCTCAIGSFILNDETLIPSYGDNDERFLDAHVECTPRYGMPQYKLGTEFNDAIGDKDQKLALEIYDQIALIV